MPYMGCKALDDMAINTPAWRFTDAYHQYLEKKEIKLVYLNPCLQLIRWQN